MAHVMSEHRNRAVPFSSEARVQHNEPDELLSIQQALLADYQNEGGINHLDGKNLPSRSEVIELANQIVWLLFPGFYDGEDIHRGNVEPWCGYHLHDIHRTLGRQIARSICVGCMGDQMLKTRERAARLSLSFLSGLVHIRSMLHKDIRAAYEGDPAAASQEEIILAYPSIQAIALHRIAHQLYKLDIPLIPRLISEHAHMRTGVDIHPGASIGESLFIDHGTGVVIGETCKVGNNVRIYQMVTLGALSFAKDDSGHLIKGRELKRHPTIEDNVVLYAGCSILGGDTTIGEGSIIGGNVWVTKSVPPGTVITFDADKIEYRRFLREAYD